LVGAAVGVRDDYLERAQALVGAGVDALVLDIAHGHAEHAVQALRRLRSQLPDAQLVAGNVATAEGAAELCDGGADAVKVGVGPGSACTTRIVAGVGVPQLTAVLDAVAVCRQNEVPVIADGGIREPGDVAKAIAAGAETVMVGNLLAGTDESPGTIVRRGGQKMKVYRGMASAEATRVRMAAEGIEPPEGTEFTQVVPEGVEAAVPHRGAAAEIVGRLVGGLRSAMSYADARSIADFHANARFVRITSAGLIESRPHDLS
jgi:IMP dehydrogenase